jgi:hypothetical protein
MWKALPPGSPYRQGAFLTFGAVVSWDPEALECLGIFPHVQTNSWTFTNTIMPGLATITAKGVQPLVGLTYANLAQIAFKVKPAGFVPDSPRITVSECRLGQTSVPGGEASMIRETAPYVVGYSPMAISKGALRGVLKYEVWANRPGVAPLVLQWPYHTLKASLDINHAAFEVSAARLVCAIDPIYLPLPPKPLVEFGVNPNGGTVYAQTVCNAFDPAIGPAAPLPAMPVPFGPIFEFDVVAKGSIGAKTVANVVAPNLSPYYQTIPVIARDAMLEII